jgi:hypothetical protein
MNTTENAWLSRLQDLLEGHHTSTGDELDAGALLLVTDPDGTEAFRAPLARHCRLDDEDHYTIWVRPILGGYQEDDGTAAFNLSLARRRALDYATVALEGDEVVFQLRSGQTARIKPAADVELVELRRWDSFTFMTLTPEEVETIDELAEDSWHGRFA